MLLGQNIKSCAESLCSLVASPLKQLSSFISIVSESFLCCIHIADSKLVKKVCYKNSYVTAAMCHFLMKLLFFLGAGDNDREGAEFKSLPV